MTLEEALDRVFANELGINVGDAGSMIEEAVVGDIPKAENVEEISNAESATATDCAIKINAILDALVDAGIMEAASNAEDDSGSK